MPYEPKNDFLRSLNIAVIWQFGTSIYALTHTDLRCSLNLEQAQINQLLSFIQDCRSKHPQVSTRKQSKIILSKINITFLRQVVIQLVQTHQYQHSTFTTETLKPSFSSSRHTTEPQLITALTRALVCITRLRTFFFLKFSYLFNSFIRVMYGSYCVRFFFLMCIDWLFSGSKPGLVEQESFT